MKAVILAAGEGQRMRPLSLDTPKPLLQVNGKPMIEHILEAFPSEIDEVIIVVKYLGHKIKKHVGDKSRHMKVRYALGSKRGTAHSFIAAKQFLEGQRFLVVYGDDLAHPFDVANCLSKDLSVLVFESKNPKAHGIGYLRKDGTLEKIVEKPAKTKSTLGINGIMVLNTDIFKHSPRLTRGEYYFSSMLASFVKKHKVFPVKAKGTINSISTPDDLVRAGKIIKAREARGSL